MSRLTEKQIDELKTNGGFRDVDIELFDMFSLDYNVIKGLQDALLNDPANAGKPIEDINEQIIHIIHENSARPFGLSNRLRTMLDFMQTHRASSVMGGKKRQTRMRKKRRKSQGTKRLKK
jgi:hypothetical protein